LHCFTKPHSKACSEEKRWKKIKGIARIVAQCLRKASLNALHAVKVLWMRTSHYKSNEVSQMKMLFDDEEENDEDY